MNKFFKYCMALQIPNGLIFLAVIISFLINKIEWLTIYDNLFLIISISIYVLINIFSLIFLILGLTIKKEMKEDESY